jgi:hypothetical protein
MKKHLVFALFMLFFSSMNAQWRTIERLDREKSFAVKTAYFGNFKFNGAIIGVEKMMRRRTVTIRKFTRTKEKNLALNFGYANVPDINENLFALLEWNKRTFYGKSGFYTELAGGAGGGFGINSVSPTTYVQNPDGTLSVKRRRDNLIMITINGGLGYDFSKKQEKPLKIFVRGGFYPIYQRTIFQDYPRLELGLVTSLAFFKKK